MSYISLKQPKIIVTAAASAITVLGLITGFKSDGVAKNLSWFVAVSGIAIASTNQFSSKLYEDSANNQADKIIAIKDKSLKAAKDRVAQLEPVVIDRDDLLRVNEELSESMTQLKAQLAELEASRGKELERVDYALNTFVTKVKESLGEHLEVSVQSLLSSIQAKRKTVENTEILAGLDKINQEVNSIYASHSHWIREINRTDDIGSFVLDTLDLYHQIHDELASLKVRLRNSLTILDRRSLKESISKEKAKQALHQFAATHQENFKHILTEVEERDRIAADNDQYVKNIIADLEKALVRVAQRDEEIKRLRQPYKWSMATRDDLRIGNVIISYFEQLGIVLDRASSDYQKWQAVLSFHIDRNNRVILASELNEHSQKLQQLSHAIEPISFSFDGESGLMVANVQLTKKPKKNSTVEEINKLWVPAAKFEATVKGWSRVRITGGSESGKSPTAENLAVCILKNRPGVAKLYNPQFDSVKNYWTIPTVGTSHNDSEKAIKELAKKVDNRANGQESREQFELWLFDEIDSTFSHTHNKKSSIADSVCFVIKQASHQNLGAIFIGQNANVTEYKGMSRSDWNSAVNVHIGNNAYDAITNSNQFTNEEQNRLKAIADKLTEFCTLKNEELQLDKTEPNAYRFALVIEPAKKPYFIELPAFGAFTYDQITSVDGVAESVASQPTLATPNAESIVNKGVAGNVVTGIAVSCPKCSSSNAKKNGRTKTTQKYQCKSCGHNYAMPLN